MKPRTLTLLTGMILLLVLVAAAAGIFYQTAGAPIHLVTVRGEHATYQGSGLYRYDPASLASEGVIWDVINLCVALPLFALAIVLSTALLLWHRSAWGYLLTGISMTVALLMSVTIAAFIAVPAIQAGQLTFIAAALLVLAFLVGLYGAGRFFWSVQQEELARPQHEMASV